MGPNFRSQQAEDIAGQLAVTHAIKNGVFGAPIFRLFLNKNRHLIKEPNRLLQLILRELDQRPSRAFPEWEQELIDDETMEEAFLQAIAQGIIDSRRSWAEHVRNDVVGTLFAYALVREFQPNAICETGTSVGKLTSRMLSAMHKNGVGRLISIDLAPREGSLLMDITLPKELVGCLIPELYRDRWKLIVGDAKLMLPKVLQELEVDLFVHDSLHTRSHQAFEYACARVYVRPGGVILSDDIEWNGAWNSFIELNRLKSYSWQGNPNFGFTTNKFDDFELEVLQHGYN